MRWSGRGGDYGTSDVDTLVHARAHADHKKPGQHFPCQSNSYHQRSPGRPAEWWRSTDHILMINEKAEGTR